MYYGPTLGYPQQAPQSTWELNMPRAPSGPYAFMPPQPCGGAQRSLLAVQPAAPHPPLVPPMQSTLWCPHVVWPPPQPAPQHPRHPPHHVPPLALGSKPVAYQPHAPAPRPRYSPQPQQRRRQSSQPSIAWGLYNSIVEGGTSHPSQSQRVSLNSGSLRASLLYNDSPPPPPPHHSQGPATAPLSWRESSDLYLLAGDSPQTHEPAAVPPPSHSLSEWVESYQWVTLPTMRNGRHCATEGSGGGHAAAAATESASPFPHTVSELPNLLSDLDFLNDGGHPQESRSRTAAAEAPHGKTISERRGMYVPPLSASLLHRAAP